MIDERVDAGPGLAVVACSLGVWCLLFYVPAVLARPSASSWSSARRPMRKHPTPPITVSIDFALAAIPGPASLSYRSSSLVPFDSRSDISIPFSFYLSKRHFSKKSFRIQFRILKPSQHQNDPAIENFTSSNCQQALPSHAESPL